ncbi:MAG: hypothetical protein IIX90_06770 [Clostridia bacterium]|nr:hypothetical protein [Clostridia bacterium]
MLLHLPVFLRFQAQKRDEEYLAQVRPAADEAAASLQGVIHWDKPLREAQYG